MKNLRRDFLKAAAAVWTGAEPRVPKWTRFETSFTSARDYEYPLETELRVSFRAPSGAVRVVRGFWDGGRTWRVRFAPNETGRWTFTTECSDRGLDGVRGALVATAPAGRTIFEKHGPIKGDAGGRHLVHEDGTRFFWLGDTAWNGPLWSTPLEWDHYVRTRSRQGFNVIQVHPGYAVEDYAGNRAFLEDDPGRPNEPFWANMDALVAAARDHGLYIALVPMWGFVAVFVGALWTKYKRLKAQMVVPLSEAR